MKSPELRKELSELILHKRGIRLNLQLPLIESEEEITLRSKDDVAQRLYALCLLHHSAQEALQPEVRRLLETTGSAGLSHLEQQQLYTPEATAASTDALSFLLWCCGLKKEAGMPDGKQALTEIATLWQAISRQPATLPLQLHLRSRTDILDWADLLYRLHWAVRHAHLNGKPVPGRLDAHAVHAWHKAVNWMIRYDDENDWDRVSTETAG
ncbi:DUF4272 domain-containing protein [Undibacterium griseum]|uniref:DUF4272 domain-containing protein n=1 Tax=Undibacterium griseum TaxID=2762295 RepID=A0ABR6YRR1_9BURK|nr:DUF4272 domain-containing protein [Undibacterium griseum]MBC3886580.1 DUF4272 domain-containing protein [Undibacterium griseum]